MSYKINDIVMKTRAFKGLNPVNYSDPNNLCIEAGLDFTVKKTPLYYSNGVDYTEVEQRSGIKRYDTGELLGVVGSKYIVIPNKEVAQTAVDIAESVGGKISHAGQLTSGNFALGSRLAFLGKIGTMHVGDDEMEKQLIITNSHDSTMSLTVYLGLMRVICSNGMVAYDQRFQNCFRIQHAENYKDVIVKAKNHLSKANDVYEKLKHRLEEYLDTKVHEEEGIQLAAASMFPKTPVKNKVTGEVDLALTPRTVKKRQRLVELYNYQNVSEHNVYRVYQAMTEYIDHDRTIVIRRKQDEDSACFNNIITGSGNDLKKRAVEICEGLCENGR